jgi:ribosomal protein L11 methyltransferase
MSTYKLTVDLADRSFAGALAAALQDLVEPMPEALTLFGQPMVGSTDAGWRIEAYYADPPPAASLRKKLESLLDRPVPALHIGTVPDLNWVALSQAALPPVRAGRFVVHGSHDRARVPSGPNAILIDAGEAFGTAHHPTTRGCLEAISRLTRRHVYAQVLDLGCGTGVLAIAAARTLPVANILATDIDARSVAVARENMQRNGAGRRIRTVRATGLETPRLRQPQSFDLIVANILADPLVSLAGGLARIVAPGGTIVLSGLLVHQAAAVAAAYRAHDFALAAHRRLEGWSTLVLLRRRTIPLRPPAGRA